jgi:hypothetical protein
MALEAPDRMVELVNERRDASHEARHQYSPARMQAGRRIDPAAAAGVRVAVGAPEASDMGKKAAFWGIVCLALTFSTPAVADPIVVTGGSMTVGYGRGSFRFHAFSLQGDGIALSGFQPDGPAQSGFFPSCHEFAPCGPGATTSPTGFVDVAAIGSATIDGTDYGLTQYFGGPANRFTFTAGDVVIPGGMSDVLALQTPFTFAGLLQVFAMNGSPQWEHVADRSLVGRGVATVNLFRTGAGYTIQNVRFDFAPPIPEPASLLLFGTGAALLLRRARPRVARN